MTILILYTIGLILWFACVLLQRSIINQQKELIDSQTKFIRKQKVKQKISNILIKEYRELSDMQKRFIEECIISDSASKAYSQTLK